jgi:ABC-type glycerol-3-phosphate transport system substrate-binding protein
LILWENLPPTQAEKLAQEIAEFSQTAPNIIIETQHYDDPQILAGAIIDERVEYDLILGPAPLLAPLQQVDKLQPMAELFPPSFLDGFVSVSLSGATRQGELWGLPDTAGFHLLLFYNRTLVETPPATTEELTELAQSLTTDSQWGLVMNSYDPLWVLPWLGGHGGWLVDSTGKPTLDTEAMVKALSMYSSWHSQADGMAPLVDYVEARDLFNQGRAAMMIDGEWAIDELSQESAIPWGVALLPVVANEEQAPQPLVLARYWALNSETTGRRVEAAIGFLEFITRSERQLAWTEEFGLLPTRRDALIAPQILTDPTLRLSAQQLQAGRGIPLGINADAILDAMRESLAEMLTGAIDPAEAARLMQLQAP